MAKTLAALLDLWPDIATLARDLGEPRDTVSSWKRRNSIPIRHWPGIVALARRQGIGGVTIPALLAASRDRR